MVNDTDAKSEAALASGRHQFVTGDAVGEWSVEVLRASGGFGAVYRVRHRDATRVAAMKVLHAHLVSSAAHRERFRLEVESVGRLRHEGIVELYEAHVLPDGRPYYLMEWVEGRNLEEAIREEGAFEMDHALSVMYLVCAALAAAHDLGLVHRDLKPSNVLIGAGRPPTIVKLADFGVAKLVSTAAEDQTITVSNARVGTPTYMAPEQILGEPVGPRTDIYSLGILLFNMLTGRLPFNASSAAEMELRQLHGQVPRLGLEGRVAALIEEVIVRCMEKAPAGRLGSAREVADALKDAALSRPPRSRLRCDDYEALGVFVEAPSGSSFVAACAELQLLDLFTAHRSERGILLITQPRSLSASPKWLHEIVQAVCAVAAKTQVAMTIHAAAVTALWVAGEPCVVGGDLLAFDAWRGSHACGLWLTPTLRARVPDLLVDPIRGIPTGRTPEDK